MRNLRKILSLLRPYRYEVIVIAFATSITILLGLALPWSLKIIFDDIFLKNDLVLLNILAISLLIISALRFCFGFIKEYLSSLICEKCVAELREKIYWHIQHLSVCYIENTPKGNLISGVIGDIDSIKRFLLNGLLETFQSLFNISFILGLLFILEWRIALAVVIYMPVYGLVFYKMAPYLKRCYVEVRSGFAKMNSLVVRY